MVELRLDQIAEKIGGQIVQGDPSRIFSRFNIDSRLSEPDELFFAIVARRNGHDYVSDAASKGARGAVISQQILKSREDFALLRVSDTLAALQALAQAVLQDHPVKVVGITGSIGKTTTKEFTAGFLSQKYDVLKSEGNFNNHLGLALSLLKLMPGHEVAVLEMGTTGTGEIRALTRIAPPDVAVITNINPVHLEFFHTLERIAQAKKEILEGTKHGGTAVLNADDPLVQKIGSEWKGERITFGLSSLCDVQASAIERENQDGLTFVLRLGAQKEKVRFPFLNEDYVSNLLAAVGASNALGLPFEVITGHLDKLKPFSKRGVLIPLGLGIRLIDDSYNSSPRALESALKNLAQVPSQRKVAVLGDMLELGEEEVEFHVRAGLQVVKYGWDLLVTIGPLSLHLAEGARSVGMDETRIFSFATSEEAADKIPSLVRQGDLILVKGSRGIKTERIVEILKDSLREN